VVAQARVTRKEVWTFQALTVCECQRQHPSAFQGGAPKDLSESPCSIAHRQPSMASTRPRSANKGALQNKARKPTGERPYRFAAISPEILTNIAPARPTALDARAPWMGRLGLPLRRA